MPASLPVRHAQKDALMPTVLTPSAAEFDAFARQQPNAHVLQTSAWMTLKSAFGWSGERVALAVDGQLAAAAQLLFRPLPFKLGMAGYLGMGPYCPDPALTPQLWQAIDAVCRRHRAALLKWEPGLVPPDQRPNYAALGFRPSPQSIQPPRTILIDIAAEDDAILARMNQGTRRKIRQSQKAGLRIWEASRAELPLFTGMMATTGARNAFGVHSPAYYALAYDLFVPAHAALFLSAHEGDPLAGVMVFAEGRTAWYLYGASSNVKRNLMGAYGVQWAAIQWAKARGCTTYDLWGIPDADEAALEAHFEARSDGLWGVYGFKRGWGGRIARSEGAFDKVYNPLVYRMYTMAVGRRG
jgi:lipid II:glycine glycyltransferase (peptidoglycan interpeptide bridge formation enzyme)